MKNQITIDRYNGEGPVSRETWKELISSLVLCGYEVYGDEKKIVFDLGEWDEVRGIEEK